MNKVELTDAELTRQEWGPEQLEQRVDESEVVSEIVPETTYFDHSAEDF